MLALLYKRWHNLFGTHEANVPQDIQLSGSHILKEHCTFENRNNAVTLIPHKDVLVYLNGRKLVEPEILRTGSRVILGKNHVFVLQIPTRLERYERNWLRMPKMKMKNVMLRRLIEFRPVRIVGKAGY
ncbi:Kinesin-like protein unc-104 [Eumeta japonica]|uniref:Kinesin-like protein unc-104 n=1 Tax=Eumeta variegata TaxID=151549 RepID=A0A4C1SN21_EUMVA|nr:Kinesin-like protein unc-104 [Eumeta japonica]